MVLSALIDCVYLGKALRDDTVSSSIVTYDGDIPMYCWSLDVSSYFNRFQQCSKALLADDSRA
jgi:hypothetical protein